MALLSDLQARQIREQLGGLADLKRITEVAEVTVRTAAGANVAGLVNLPATVRTDVDNISHTDEQVEAVVMVRRAELPEPLPALNKTHRVVVKVESVTLGTYQLLAFAPHNALATVYRLDLRLTGTPRYG